MQVPAHILVAGAAHAGPLWECTTAGNSYSSGTRDFAATFTVNQDLTVSSLGFAQIR